MTDRASAPRAHLFATLVKDRLLVKLPGQRVDRLLGQNDVARLDPGHGRAMKEWVRVAPEADEGWLALARGARARSEMPLRLGVHRLARVDVVR